MGVIVAGTDFTTRSDRALLRAILLARQTGSELLIVTVLEQGAGDSVSGENRHNAAIALRQTQSAIIAREGLACRFDIRSGEPARELAAAAEDAGAQLIVIGPDRRGLIRDTFGAVTAERIVRAAPVPLIVAKGNLWADYERILVPVELAEISQETLRGLRGLDWAGDAALTLLHVYDPDAREILGRSLVPVPERKRYLADCDAAAKEALRAFAAAEGMEGSRLMVEMANGPVSATVARVAAEDRSDLIVVSPNRKGFFGRQLLGSTTENLLRASAADLLVVPRASKDCVQNITLQ